MNRQIELHADLDVDPAREAAMMKYFESTYRPAAEKFPGYVALNLLRLEAVPMGTRPSGLTYRFSIRYQSEAQRQAWVASDVHTEVWGTLETFLASHDYTFLLFDVY